MAANGLDRFIIRAMKGKIKGQVPDSVFCDIRDDALFVKIRNEMFTWEGCLDDLHKFIGEQFNLDVIADKFVKEYQDCVVSESFQQI